MARSNNRFQESEDVMDYKELVVMFQPVADKLAAEGMSPDNIAYKFAQYAKQKANQEKEKARDKP